MAPVSGRPFLEIQLDYLITQGIESVTLCTGYLSEVIENHFGKEYRSISIEYSIETSPLGTGGAIKKALQSTDQNQVVILNGDSYFGVDLAKMMSSHQSSGRSMTLALKQMRDFDRYGTVILDKDHKVRQFKEKATTRSGWINGGVYIIDTSFAELFPLEEVFSFETFMTEQVHSGLLGGFLSDGYFIDIGIPEDYETAQHTLPLIADQSFRGWTLFLDRDGVINERTPGDYVKSMDEWVYCDGALEAISKLSKIFDRIIVVTNQQGVPLGRMSSYALDLIHQNLRDDVRSIGGHIDAIFASLDLKEKLNNSRKPNPAMAHWAQRAFPDIDFTKAIMVGDSASDIEFGQGLGMRTACVDGKFEDTADIEKLKPNWYFKNLAHFADVYSKPSAIIDQVIGGLPFTLK